MFDFIHVILERFLVRSGFATKQHGATLIEYALIISAIAVVVLVGSLAVTGNLTTFFNDLGGQLSAT